MEDRKETMENRKEAMEDRKDSVEAEIDQAAEILGSRLMDSLQEYKQTHSLNNFDPEIEFLDNNLTKMLFFKNSVSEIQASSVSARRS